MNVTFPSVRPNIAVIAECHWITVTRLTNTLGLSPGYTILVLCSWSLSPASSAPASDLSPLQNIWSLTTSRASSDSSSLCWTTSRSSLSRASRS